MASSARQRSASFLGAQGPCVLLLLATIALTVIGLVMVYSASSASLAGAGEVPWADVRSQAIYAVLGVVVMAVVWKLIPYHVWNGAWTWAAWGIALVLLALTALMGSEGYGATRWLSLGPISLQPSEVAKVAFLLMSIRVICAVRSGSMEPRAMLVQILLLILAPLLFLYWSQSDLGTTLICAVGIVAVLWLGGVPAKYLAALCVLGVLFVLYAIFGSDYRSGRMVYLDPWNDGQGGYGTGYNIIRSYYAIAEGGLFGVGVGQGHERFDYLFASDSDFIFAIVCEELGMLGALVVIALFLVILFAGLRIANGAPDEFGALIAGGFAIMLVFQAFLNIGCTIGVFPTTGKPLPFISSGGTSLLVSFSMVGLILSVAQAADAPSVYEQRRADLRVVRANGDPGRAASRAPGRSGSRGGSSRPRSGARFVEVDAFAPASASARPRAAVSRARAGAGHAPARPSSSHAGRRLSPSGARR
ncbi:FtsW/RodA/SpoVE family cell cycle protein [Adlercreutzia sp. ZJ242]|uniref:FtsW/RodA/SpoVE family cell cycle protein n=1 Tax=Adlercreutzia sp. ZJ242 TaxID=2709409 RepID=UPI0013EB95CD|nr:FtsW/RodA/SpoVE family cell cycle protein [Adlercreutzia sp. ZJ242]